MRKIKLNKATFIYYYLRLVKEKGTPEYVAKGWATGVFVGFLVPVGFQLVIAIPLAFLVKGSKIGATVGTFISNNFTIIVLYPLQCWIGSYILANPLSFSKIKSDMANLFKEPCYSSLLSLGSELIASFFVGGIFLAAIFTPISYFVVKWFIIKHRHNVELRKMRKIKKQEF
ncbi:MAG: DUF2062 domain-containing protein [Victivallaceae bacterium]|jgi:uncharacterized protein (DUF2062 family)|nr:DUF2062 domain-containing protein [Victivallaceae bacterium]MDD5664360.1 DUF2062 domain-containing protein [Victivallaceae bacterium]